MMAKHAAPCLFPQCGLGKNAGVHWGSGEGKHDYQGEPKAGGFGQQKRPIASRSSRPNRVQRYEDGQKAMREHREAVTYCEAPEAGIPTPCGTGADSTLEQSHVIGKGIGGAKDYGMLKTLCRKHHRELDSNREQFRAAGLAQRRPPADLPPRRGRPSRFS